MFLQIGDDNVSVSCLENPTTGGGNSFKWPTKEDILDYSFEEILCKIDPPTPINQRGHFSISLKDLKIIEDEI